MDINSVYSLMDKFEASTLSSMELKMEGVEISFKKSEGVVVAPAVTTVATPVTTTVAKEPVVKEEVKAAADEGVSVKAPLVGTFYRAASPEEKPFVMVGQKVKKGDIIGIIEAMKLMNEVMAPVDGEVVSIEAADGEMVQFDQILMNIKES